MAAADVAPRVKDWAAARAAGRNIDAIECMAGMAIETTSDETFTPVYAPFDGA